MTSEQVFIVQSSFPKIDATADSSAEMFFKRLFELDASFQEYFKGDLQIYKRKFIQLLHASVRGLHRMEIIIPVMRELGRRQAKYGIPFEKYNTIGAALFWSLAHSLEDDFTPEVMAAWAEAFNLLANIMKNAVVINNHHYTNAQAI